MYRFICSSDSFDFEVWSKQRLAEIFKAPPQLGCGMICPRGKKEKGSRKKTCGKGAEFCFSSYFFFFFFLWPCWVRNHSRRAKGNVIFSKSVKNVSNASQGELKKHKTSLHKLNQLHLLYN